jgi:hypothetical protein
MLENANRRNFLRGIAAAPALAVPVIVPALAAPALSQTQQGCLDLLAPLSEYDLDRAQRVLICMFHPEWEAALAELDEGRPDA